MTEENEDSSYRSFAQNLPNEADSIRTGMVAIAHRSHLTTFNSLISILDGSLTPFSSSSTWRSDHLSTCLRSQSKWKKQRLRSSWSEPKALLLQMAVLVPYGSGRVCSSRSLFPTLCGLLVSKHAGGEGTGNVSGLTIYIRIIWTVSSLPFCSSFFSFSSPFSSSIADIYKWCWLGHGREPEEEYTPWRLAVLFLLCPANAVSFTNWSLGQSLYHSHTSYVILQRERICIKKICSILNLHLSTRDQCRGWLSCAL